MFCTPLPLHLLIRSPLIEQTSFILNELDRYIINKVKYV